MSEDAAEFRDAIREAVRRHDVDADDLRAVADGLRDTADKWDAMDTRL